MQHKHLQFGQGFHVAMGNRHSQAAQMTLLPGDSEGDDENRHKGADQWLYVVSGTGVAIINDERIKLRTGTLLLIERKEIHEICNTGKSPLKTLNIYVPPAYSMSGEELPSGKS